MNEKSSQKSDSIKAAYEKFQKPEPQNLTQSRFKGISLTKSTKRTKFVTYLDSGPSFS